MRIQIVVAVRAFLVVTVLTGLCFPLVLTGIVHLGFHDKANGSLVTRDGQLVGSTLLAQGFTDARYFHPRPSAAAVDESGFTVSGASNLGPTNDSLLDSVRERADGYRAENGLAASTPVPVDAITASASGLDPHISVANARLQAQRVAAARGMAVDDVMTLITEHTDGALLGVLGDEGVNVLTLNLALDDGSGR